MESQNSQFITENLNDVQMEFNKFYDLTILNYKVRAFYTQRVNNVTKQVEPKIYFRVNDICVKHNKEWSQLYRDRNGQPNKLKQRISDKQAKYSYPLEMRFDLQQTNQNQGLYYSEDIIITIVQKIDEILEDIVNDLIINIHFKNKTREQQQINDQLIKKTQKSVYKYADNYNAFIKNYGSKIEALQALKDFQCLDSKLQKMANELCDDNYKRQLEDITKKKRNWNEQDDYEQDYEDFPFFYITIELVYQQIDSDNKRKQLQHIFIYKYLYLFLVYNKQKQLIIDSLFTCKNESYTPQQLAFIEDESDNEDNDASLYSKQVRDLNTRFFNSQNELLKEYPDSFQNEKLENIYNYKSDPDKSAFEEMEEENKLIQEYQDFKDQQKKKKKMTKHDGNTVISEYYFGQYDIENHYDELQVLFY